MDPLSFSHDTQDLKKLSAEPSFLNTPHVIVLLLFGLSTVCIPQRWKVNGRIRMEAVCDTRLLQ